MRLNRYLTLAFALIFSGCASYVPTLKRLDPFGANSKKTVIEELLVYVEEYATAEKSERAFDTKLAERGVLPLLILVENTGQHSYEIKTADVVVRGNAALKSLSPEEAASKAERGTLGPAVGWSLIVPNIGIPAAAVASAMHTRGVNRQIVRDFQNKGFLKGTIEQKKERSGFLFFQLDEGKKDLTGLTFEMRAKNLATNEVVIVAFPLPEATFGPQ